MSFGWFGENSLMTSYAVTSPEKSLSILDLIAMKQSGEKISCLTAYDATFSQLIDQAGIDVMLVGDSLGMVIQGKKTTVPVTIDEMVYHTQCVVSSRKRAFVIADLPFLSYSTIEEALHNAARLMQKGEPKWLSLRVPIVILLKY